MAVIYFDFISFLLPEQFDPLAEQISKVRLINTLRFSFKRRRC